MVIFGTRPECIKLAPVIKALEQCGDFEVVITVTAQHREMLDQFLNFFGLEPDYDLNIMQHGQTLAEVTCRALSGLDDVLGRESVDMVIVQGDTTTAFVATLAAYYHRVPSAHVEAGLRTYDKMQPFPEEINRRLIGTIADLHFAPTAKAKQNLLREGVEPERIFISGNTVVDALLECLERLPPVHPNSFGRMLLVTAHRRENWGEPLKRVCRALIKILEHFSDVKIVFPMHRNPAVREIATAYLSSHKRVELIEPPDYFGFIQLMRLAHIIVTDSGGVQEEAPTLGKPVLVLREVTERPEAVEVGVARLVGTDENVIVSELCKLLSDEDAYMRMARKVNPYGDGKASQRIVNRLRCFFGLCDEHPEEFKPSF
ncbi:MAG: UDP-N-acetylglucosamine 2-epimerase (non-hydrolyzing) [Armatimonadetes bacterium]|nr:UDP-N-acetylglucosamine 2-epimerase (non-hydrolyzing) [Armatimonadota bacterium]